ncbi:hypothetical protein [Halofilum ochraceum]|uniref:hypothetical protein n=1 Tax=Halofilum ochraceum TaxID=1611323 RepID=UPI0008299B34|nr:hypothetical protein [Halofilum ochraceum]
MESLEATTDVLRKRATAYWAAPYLLVALLGALPATSAIAEEVAGDLIVKGAACVGTKCTSDSFPFDGLRIHDSEPVLSMIDRSNDGTDTDWSIGITDDNGTGGFSEFFIRDEVSGAEVLRMTTDGRVALGAGAALGDNAYVVSVGADGSERRVTWVADAEADTDAVNKRQFDEFQADVLASVGTDAEALETELQEINTRIDDLAERIDRLAREMQ